MILIGATGRLVKGNLFDVRPKAMERVLKDYDPQLYVKGNTEKYGGWGCWEIRRRSNLPEKVLKLEHKGVKLYRYEYTELDIINHVLDVPFLDYQTLGKLKSIDTWATDNWVAKLEDDEFDEENAAIKRSLEEMKYRFRQHKREMKDFKEAVASGYNPLDFFMGQYKS